MRYSTEYVSDDYLHMNSCYVQYLYDHDTGSLRPNGRSDYLLLYIAEGKCYATVNQKQLCIEAGNLVLFRPGEPQAYSFKKADRSVLCSIHFTGTGCDALLREIDMQNKNIIFVGSSKKILSVFEKTTREFTLKTPEYQSFCDAYLFELFASIKRQLAYKNNPTYIKNNALVDAVCRLMYDEYAQSVPLKRYADFCHLSVSRFAHMFKSCTGSSPLEYIMRIRIEKAMHFLVYTDLSITEIADLTGFSSQNYFGRIFKRFTGTSPKRFAAENRT